LDRRLKKLTHKYEFLKLELEEAEDEAEAYTYKWAKLFGKYFAKKEAEFWLNEDTGELRKELPEEETKKRPPKPKKLKDLYKQLSKHTHPDKGGDESDFNEVKEYYDKEDLLGLISLAGQFNIKYDLEDEDEEILIKSVYGLESKIKTTQGTLSWAYFTGEKKKKKAVSNMMEQQLNIIIDPEDYPEELL
jgi:hypothetical protein